MSSSNNRTTCPAYSCLNKKIHILFMMKVPLNKISSETIVESCNAFKSSHRSFAISRTHLERVVELTLGASAASPWASRVAFAAGGGK